MWLLKIVIIHIKYLIYARETYLLIFIKVLKGFDFSIYISQLREQEQQKLVQTGSHRLVRSVSLKF